MESDSPGTRVRPHGHAGSSPVASVGKVSEWKASGLENRYGLAALRVRVSHLPYDQTGLITGKARRWGSQLRFNEASERVVEVSSLFPHKWTLTWLGSSVVERRSEKPRVGSSILPLAV
jgi:hypothetical protein